jgi:hypothetical protein
LSDDRSAAELDEGESSGLSVALVSTPSTAQGLREGLAPSARWVENAIGIDDRGRGCSAPRLVEVGAAGQNRGVFQVKPPLSFTVALQFRWTRHSRDRLRNARA